MGCGLSTRLNPEDAATLSHGRMSSDRDITDINSPATSKNLNHGGDDSVLSSAQWSQKSVSSSQGKDAKHVGEGGEKEEGEKEEEDYHSEVLIFPRSPSFRVYCIASSSSRNQSFISDSFNDNDSASSIKKNGDEDSTNKLEDKKERKKKERRIRGLRGVMQKGMPRRKKNLLNFGCYTSNASYDEKPV